MAFEVQFNHSSNTNIQPNFKQMWPIFGGQWMMLTRDYFALHIKTTGWIALGISSGKYTILNAFTIIC